MTLDKILEAAVHSLAAGTKKPHCFSAFVPGKGYINDGKDPATLDDYRAQAAKAAQAEVDNLMFATGYAEPGYDDPEHGVIFADWNKFPSTLTDILERRGYRVEWSDEWTTCIECSKAIRTSPDSYSWKRSYIDTDNGELCAACALDDPTQTLEDLEGRGAPLTLDLDPEKYGYIKINDDSYEHGLHGGQNDAPEVIAAALKRRGITRYIFKLDDVEQFSCRFSCYVHEDQWDRKSTPSRLDYDPAEEMAKALRGEPTAHITIKEMVIDAATIARCPNHIIHPAHYHADGTCECATENFSDVVNR